MQVANAPLKWLIPWAQQNTNIFELPQTTSDPTRASQSQGFPAQTMLPPESGGVPPQGIDFNAGVWQISRIVWWLMYGAPFVYDATFATNSAISGYAQGARIASTDYLGVWLSTTDNNQAVPDTTGTGWVPGAAYGATSLALTNTNVTLTPLQAMKKILIFTGTLTGNVVITLPAWVYDWTVVNQCTGNFTLTLTTSGGSGAVVAQGGTTRLRGDGTNINSDVNNVAPGGNAQSAATLRQLQTQTATAFAAAGTAPAYTLTPSPSLSTLAAGLRFRVAFAANGTYGSNTLNVNGLGAVSLVQYDGAGNLLPAVVVAGMLTDVEYNGTSWVVLDPLVPSYGLAGSFRNGAMLVAAASASTTFTADEIIVATALGGADYKLSNFSKTINLATTGAGGMDTGTAPVSGYVGVYAIYNPTTGAAALLATNATSAAVPSVYGGANLPSGYTASCLVSVWPTTAASLFDVGTQVDRTISTGTKVVINSNTVQGTLTSVTTTAFPKNARTVSGSLSVQNTSAASMSINIYAAGISVGQQSNNASVAASQQVVNNISKMAITVPQTTYWTSTSSAGTPTFGFNVTSYDI